MDVSDLSDGPELPLKKRLIRCLVAAICTLCYANGRKCGFIDSLILSMQLSEIVLQFHFVLTPCSCTEKLVDGDPSSTLRKYFEASEFEKNLMDLEEEVKVM
ncbi:hypothetical protein ILYODFUR_036234 [Ilyodon furcidens]|uniref:Uncharacterized protein n=1 Tax=Ilyodon furcidens TaxID=33524 RepID=A0ABV0U3E9_9TELE